MGRCPTGAADQSLIRQAPGAVAPVHFLPHPAGVLNA